MSKGHNPRPFSVPRDEFRENWDKVFGTKRKESRTATDAVVSKLGRLEVQARGPDRRKKGA